MRFFGKKIYNFILFFLWVKHETPESFEGNI